MKYLTSAEQFSIIPTNISDQTVKFSYFLQKIVSGLLGVDGLLVLRPVDIVLYKERGL